jgi:hypothetical protein
MVTRNKLLRPRLTYANVMSTIAVFAALATSGAYAASKLGPDDIAANAIRSKHIKAGAVNGKDVRNASLSGSDVKADSLTGDDILEASLGQVATAAKAQLASGVAGDSLTGAAVQDGSLTGADIDESTLAGIGGLQFVTNASASNSDSPKGVTTNCPPGKRPLTGGFDLIGGKTGTPPNMVSHVAVDQLAISGSPEVDVFVEAYEAEPTAEAWSVTAHTWCVNSP